MSNGKAGVGSAKQKPNTGCKDKSQKCDHCPKSMMDKVKACNGGVLAAAKEASGGNEVTIEQAEMKGVKGATQLDPYGNNHVIKINSAQDECVKAQVLLFELQNVANKPLSLPIMKSAFAGDLNRDQFIRRMEEVEYSKVQKQLAIYDECKDKWCCSNTPSELERYKGKSFDDYYDDPASMAHKEIYGKRWDEYAKEAYEAKHH